MGIGDIIVLIIYVVGMLAIGVVSKNKICLLYTSQNI